MKAAEQEMVGKTPQTYKPLRERQKPSRGKHVIVSPEVRKEYEATMRAWDDRERQHGQFLPSDLKGKR